MALIDTKVVPIIVAAGSRARKTPIEKTPIYFETKESFDTSVPVGTRIQDNELNQYILTGNLDTNHITNLLDVVIPDDLLVIDIPTGTSLRTHRNSNTVETQTNITVIPSVGTIVKFPLGTRMRNVITLMDCIINDPNKRYLLLI